MKKWKQHAMAWITEHKKFTITAITCCILLATILLFAVAHIEAAIILILLSGGLGWLLYKRSAVKKRNQANPLDDVAENGVRYYRGIQFDDDEEILYDERHHWLMSLTQLFDKKSGYAALILLGSIVLPLPMAVQVVVGLCAAMFYIRQEAGYIWRRIVVTSLRVLIIENPPLITLAPQRTFSIPRKDIQVANAKRPFLARLLGASHFTLDTPSSKDEAFNFLKWVRHPKNFVECLKSKS